MAPDIVIVGLGNPGPQYENTRHNFGFLVVDAFIQSVVNGRADWRVKDGADYWTGRWCSKELLVVKPMTFMNLSGEPLGRLLRFFKYGSVKERSIKGGINGGLIVCHDELDLPFGTVRLKRGGGEGGHNGLRSITAHVGTAEYDRLRLGIGKSTVIGGRDNADESRADESRNLSQPRVISGRKNESIAQWVLKRFAQSEEQKLSGLISISVDMIKMYIIDGIHVAQQRYHSKK